MRLLAAIGVALMAVAATVDLAISTDLSGLSGLSAETQCPKVTPPHSPSCCAADLVYAP
jgi:hypothetical protein